MNMELLCFISILLLFIIFKLLIYIPIGLCENCGGVYGLFMGTACQHLSCYSDSSQGSCSGEF